MLSRFFLLLLLVIFSLLQLNHASPVVDQRENANQVVTSEKNSDPTTTTETSIFVKVGSELVLGFFNGVLVAMLSVALYAEVLCMAAGSHLLILEGGYLLEKQHQAIAATVGDLWTKLQTMEDVDKILVNATQDTATYVLNSAGGNLIGNILPGAGLSNMFNSSVKENILNYLFDKTEQQLKANPSLYKIYIEQKEKIERNLPPLKNGTINLNSLELFEKKMSETFMSNSWLRNIVVNKRFLEYASANLIKPDTRNDTTFENQLLTRSILLLSSAAAPSLKPEETSRVQNIYDLAVKSTAENIDMLSSKVNKTAIDNTLFTSLKESFKKDPQLDSALTSVKDNLLKGIGF